MQMINDLILRSKIPSIKFQNLENVFLNWRSFIGKNQMNSDPAQKIQWHPAFCAAAELELRSNKSDLEFKREYNLSKKPLQMDLLIIEKRKRCAKGLGEKVNQIPLRELTISLFRASIPKELLSQLSKKTKQLTIANKDGNAALQCRIRPQLLRFIYIFTVPLLLLLRSLR